jgi:hypothetical protein
MGTEDKPIQRRSITLPEPVSNRGSYSEPGYYVVDQTGNPVSSRYDTAALAFANLRGGAGVQYLDQPLGGHLNQPWPPELHTVVGHTQGEQMPQFTEADLLRAMASTNDLDEQRYLMGALEEVRRDTRQVMAGAEQVDFAPPHHVGEERSFYPYHSGAFGSSSATDWLAEMGSSNDGMAEHMLTMGSRFFIGCHPEVKADPVEYMTQALGVARVAAGQFEDVEGAVNIFMDHVANLARVDMKKIAVDELLPWAAPPERLEPTDSNYPGPDSQNKNTDVNPAPPEDPNLPGLDNGESSRQMMGGLAGLSTLSSHPHMSEFLFEADMPGPSPEELAQLSGPGNLDQQFGAPASSQDDSAGSGEAGVANDHISGPTITASRKQAESKAFGGHTHTQLVHALTDHDRKQQNKPHYNMYALPQYLHAATEISDKITGGMPPDEAIDAHLSGRLRDVARKAVGLPREAAQHQADYQYIDSDNNIHKHVEGKGPLEGPIISHHDSHEEAVDAFKAMMMGKHGGSLGCQCREYHGNFVLRSGQRVSSYIDRRQCPQHNGSRAFNPDPTTYEEYLGRLAPGSAAVPREFFSGAMAAHSPSENDVSVPAWGRRQGPKVTEKPTDYRGVTASTTRLGALLGHLKSKHPGADRVDSSTSTEETYGKARAVHQHDHELGRFVPHTHGRTAANEDMLNPQAFERADESDAPAIREQSSGGYDPKATWAQSGEAAHDVTGLIPQGDLSEEFSNISDFPDTGDAAVPSTRARTAMKWSPASGMGGKGMTNREYMGLGNTQEERMAGLYGEFSPTHTYNPIGWDALDARPHPGSAPITAGSPVQLHGKMDPSGHLVHVRDENENHQTIDKRSLGTLHREGALRRAAWSGYEPGPYEPSPKEENRLREHLLGAHGFGEGVLGPDVERMHRLHDMDHAEIEEGQGIPGGAYSHSHEAAFRMTAADDDDDDDEGSKVGGPQDVPGAYEPDRSLYSESPEGQAEATRGYEEAYSSGRMIDFTGAGVDVLGTVPVQGYMQDADHPQGEMWTWQQEPIGSPPRGAADVADVPTAGMISEQQTGSSYPQPTVTNNPKLDSFRASIAARMGA